MAFFNFKKRVKKPQNVKSESNMGEQGPFFSQDVTFGDHLYRQPGETAEVIFSHRAKKVRRVIVNDAGCICSFPGFAEPKKLRKCLNGHTLPKPVIRFRTSFNQETTGRFLMIWEIQPDGRYWEDGDGFGSTSDKEICLYSHIDEKGKFTHPFQIYSIGSQVFYSKSIE